jgi:primosomal protein N' (replication factor Y)
MTGASPPDALTGIVRVALPVPLPQTFSYLPNSSTARAGSRVRVPFGRTRRIGVLVEAGTEAGVAGQPLKTIDAVLDEEPLLGPELLASLRRAADYWCGAIGEVILVPCRSRCVKAARPPSLPRKRGD